MLTVKAWHVDFLVGSDDDANRLGDVGFGQEVLHAFRAVGFDFDGDAHFFGLFLKGGFSHVSMGNASGAGRDRDDEGLFCWRGFNRGRGSSCFGGSLFSFFGFLGGLGISKELQDLIRGGRFFEGSHQLRVDQQRRQCC